MTEIGTEVVELTDLVTSRLKRAERKAQVRIRRRRMAPPPAVVKAAADAAVKKEFAKESSQSIREIFAREEIPAVLSSAQDAARINADAMSGRPLLPAWAVFADGSRAERRQGKAEIRFAVQESFRNLAEDAGEFSSCYDDYDDDYFDDEFNREDV